LFRAVKPHRLPADFPYGWHQDGAFLGRGVRALDLWITLTSSGRDAPGLEVLPRRVERILSGGGMFDWDISTPTIEKEFPGVRAAFPEFSPGDAMFIDHLTVHRAGQTPTMTETRHGIECWTFAAGAFPAQYAGLAL
jgi:hypothetical protein